jgi:hypothetical protein
MAKSAAVSRLRLSIRYVVLPSPVMPAICVVSASSWPTLVQDFHLAPSRWNHS